MNPQPKEIPWRSEAYLRYVRSHNCADCGWPSWMGGIQSHHIKTGGMATKAGDEWTVPLCGPFARGCHGKADKSQESAEKYKSIAERLYAQYQGRK